MKKYLVAGLLALGLFGLFGQPVLSEGAGLIGGTGEIVVQSDPQEIKVGDMLTLYFVCNNPATTVALAAEMETKGEFSQALLSQLSKHCLRVPLGQNQRVAEVEFIGVDHDGDNMYLIKTYGKSTGNAYWFIGWPENLFQEGEGV